MRESSCHKIMRSKAAKDRTIVTFPLPFSPSCTPYPKTDFDLAVKDACLADKTITTGLKISKAIIVGNVAVGKTSLVNRFCHHTFDRDYKATIGVDFEVERFDINQVPFNLQIWDTAGQERFKCIAASYYRGAHVIIVVFDLTDLRSLHCCREWLSDAIICNRLNPHIFLVGTKKDLILDAAYKTVARQAKIVAKQMKAEYWTVSSKENENVDAFFCRVAALAFNASVLRECETVKQIKMGSELIQVNNNGDNLVEVKRKNSNCVCNIQ